MAEKRKKTTSSKKKTSRSKEKPAFTEKKIGGSKKTVKKKTVKKPRKKAAPKKKAPSKASKINRELKEIYENSDGSMPNMREFKPRKKRGVFRAFVTLFFALIFLGAVAWIGFFILQPTIQFSQEDVVLSVSGDEQVKAGEQVQYRIRYKNNQNVPITNVKLEVRYPAGFVFERASTDPTADTNDAWDLESLENGEGGIIDIFGQFYAARDDEQSVRAFLNYTPGNFSSAFQKADALTTVAKSSVVGVSFDGGDEVARGLETAFRLSAKNLDKLPENITQVLLTLDAPAFTLKESNIDPTEDGRLEWVVDSAAEKPGVDVLGTFAGDDDIISITIRALGLTNGRSIDDALVLAEETMEIALIETTVTSKLLINGGITNLSVQPGEKINTSIVVRNDGEADLEDIRIRLVYDMPSANNKSILHWAKIDDPTDGDIRGEQVSDTIRRGEITWTSRHDRSLKSIPAGESATIDLTLPVKSGDDVDLAAFADGEFTGEAYVDVQYETAGEISQVSSNKIVVTFNSDLDFEARHEAAPAPNDQKMYTLTWLLTNTFHELKDIRVEADFFGDVSFDEKSTLTPPAGTTEVDNDKNRLVWTVDSIPLSLDVLAYQFKVKLHSANSGQTQFTSKIKLEATDAVTGERILRVAEAIGL